MEIYAEIKKSSRRFGQLPKNTVFQIESVDKERLTDGRDQHCVLGGPGGCYAIKDLRLLTRTNNSFFVPLNITKYDFTPLKRSVWGE